VVSGGGGACLGQHELKGGSGFVGDGTRWPSHMRGRNREGGARRRRQPNGPLVTRGDAGEGRHLAAPADARNFASGGLWPTGHDSTPRDSDRDGGGTSPAAPGLGEHAPGIGLGEVMAMLQVVRREKDAEWGNDGGHTARPWRPL
jgi:hypothetical protein